MTATIDKMTTGPIALSGTERHGVGAVLCGVLGSGDSAALGGVAVRVSEHVVVVHSNVTCPEIGDAEVLCGSSTLGDVSMTGCVQCGTTGAVLGLARILSRVGSYIDQVTGFGNVDDSDEFMLSRRIEAHPDWLTPGVLPGCEGRGRYGRDAEVDLSLVSPELYAELLAYYRDEICDVFDDALVAKGDTLVVFASVFELGSGWPRSEVALYAPHVLRKSEQDTYCLVEVPRAVAEDLAGRPGSKVRICEGGVDLDGLSDDAWTLLMELARSDDGDGGLDLTELVDAVGKMEI
jgi:hypothetical protein